MRVSTLKGTALSAASEGMSSLTGISKDTGGLMVTMEGADPSSEVKSAVEDLGSVIAEVAIQLGLNEQVSVTNEDSMPVLFNKTTGLTVTQESAALTASIMSFDKKMAGRELTVPEAKGSNHKVINDGKFMSDASVTMESYDDRDVENLQEATMMYAMLSSKPTDFAEAHFPVITLDPASNGFKIITNLLYTQRDITRRTSGAVQDFNRRPVVRAWIDGDAINSTQSKLIPVFRDGENDELFVDKAWIAPRSVKNGDVTILTSPLKVEPGKEFDLIGLSQTDDLISRGLANSDSQLDNDAGIEYLYLADMTDPANPADIIRVSVRGVASARFNASRIDSAAGMTLNMKTSNIILDPEVVTTANSVPAGDLKLLKSKKYAVRLNLGFSLVTDSETAAIATMGKGTIETVEVFDTATGDVLGVADPDGIKIIKAIKAMEIIGMDFDAKITNLNRVFRGGIVGRQVYTREHFIGYGDPLTIPKAMNTTTTQAEVESLISLSHAAMDDGAVTKILETAEALRYAKTNSNSSSYDIVDEAYARPTFVPDEVDFAKLQVRRSGERQDDIAEWLGAAVKNVATQLIGQSGILAGLTLHDSTGNAKLTCVVGTSYVLAENLRRSTVLRDAERVTGMKFLIVSTPNRKFTDKVSVTFSVFDENRSVQACPVSFGACGYIPDVVFNIHASRGQSNSNELAAFKRWKQVVTCKVLGMIDVKEINKAFTRKVA